jgi:hypothetical protein
MLHKSSLSLLVIVIISAMAPNAHAQNYWGQGTLSGGLGVQLSLPIGNLSDQAGIGFGGFGKLQYGLNDDWMLTGSLGFTYWTNKDQGGGVTTHASAFTLLGGAKYNLGKYVTPGFYGLGEVGFYFEHYAFTTPNFFGGNSTHYAGQTEFALCLGVGYQFQTFDVSAKYVAVTDESNLAVSFAYQLPLK